jgi:hypothetical protein
VKFDGTVACFFVYQGKLLFSRHALVRIYRVKNSIFLFVGTLTVVLSACSKSSNSSPTPGQRKAAPNAEESKYLGSVQCVYFKNNQNSWGISSAGRIPYLYVPDAVVLPAGANPPLPLEVGVAYMDHDPQFGVCGLISAIENGERVRASVYGYLGMYSDCTTLGSDGTSIIVSEEKSLGRGEHVFSKISPVGEPTNAEMASAIYIPTAAERWRLETESDFVLTNEICNRFLPQ